MKTHSQSKQDLFALLVADGYKGFFLDIGCSIPSFQSNTKLLLENGWEGVCIDIEPRHEEWKEFPKAHFIQADATKIEWGPLSGDAHDRGTLGFSFPARIDYASVDVDFLTYEALKNLINSWMKPRCLTVEHDAYRFGDKLRVPQRRLMIESGYNMVRENVQGSDGSDYEDWYCHDSFRLTNEFLMEVQSW